MLRNAPRMTSQIPSRMSAARSGLVTIAYSAKITSVQIRIAFTFGCIGTPPGSGVVQAGRAPPARAVSDGPHSMTADGAILTGHVPFAARGTPGRAHSDRSVRARPGRA